MVIHGVVSARGATRRIHRMPEFTGRREVSRGLVRRSREARTETEEDVLGINATGQC